MALGYQGKEGGIDFARKVSSLYGPYEEGTAGLCGRSVEGGRDRNALLTGERNMKEKREEGRLPPMDQKEGVTARSERRAGKSRWFALRGKKERGEISREKSEEEEC